MENYDINETLKSIEDQLLLTESNAGEMYVYRNDNIVSQAIVIYGEYCFAEIAIMARYLTPSSLYLDIGTNIGYHALTMHNMVNCPVLGFEPHPVHFAVAALNTRDKNIKLYNAACSNKSEPIRLNDFDVTTMGNYGEAHRVSDEDNSIEVACLKIDELKLQMCDLMKIDVEGEELNVMKGASRTIKKFRPVIFFEALEESNWRDCYKYLAERDYSMYWVVSRVNPISHKTFKESKVHPFNDTASFNIISIPNEKEQPTDLAPVTPDEWYHELVKRIRQYRLVL